MTPENKGKELFLGSCRLALDVLDRIADGLQVFSLIVRNLGGDFFFKGHDELDDIKRVGIQIFDETGVIGNLIRGDCELFHDELFAPKRKDSNLDTISGIARGRRTTRP